VLELLYLNFGLDCFVIPPLNLASLPLPVLKGWINANGFKEANFTR